MGRRWFVVGLIAAVGLTVATYRYSSARQFRQALTGAVRDFDRGRYAASLRTLQHLGAPSPPHGEVAYRIGLCEQALGNHAEALRAWEQVSLAEPFGREAAVARGTLLVNKLRFRAAEDLLESTLRRAPSSDVRQALTRLYRFEGRARDVRRLLEEECDSADDPVIVLNDLWLLDSAPWPIAAIEKIAAKGDSGDDRIWLARANIAVMTGQFDAAQRALSVCLRARPDDPAVWDARLALARRTNDVEAARDALSHLPATWFSAGEELAFRAWWAAQGSDRARERRVLEGLLSRRPSDTQALERLADLSLGAGNVARAAECRARKVEFDELRERYRSLMNNPLRLERAHELSTVAASLGREFDARAWAALDARRRSNDPEALTRLRRLALASERRPAGTLLDRFADVISARSPLPGKGFRDPRFVPPVFTDDAESAGLKFFQDNGARDTFYLPEIMAGGLALLDFDGDGWLDVYAVQGGPFPPSAEAPSPGDRLFRNRGDGSFDDVTDRSGIARMPRGFGHGAAVGDFNNDGRPDLFVTRWNGYALYRNAGDGTFDDVTEAAGLAGARDWPTSAAWADFDNDGDLDLYVCHYLRFDPASAPICTNSSHPTVRAYCDPTRFEACTDHLFRNEDGRFVDVTAAAGIADRQGRGLGILAADFDDDGRVDLLVANDMSANYCFRNKGGFVFEEVAHEVGVASNADGGYHAGMGIACGDLDGDGLLDLFVTNAYSEATTFYRNFGQGVFTDRTAASGLAVATRYLAGFGVATLDYDNNGILDLISANGNLNDARPYNPYPMRVQLLAGQPGGRLADASGTLGSPWSSLRLGRGLAAGDLDNDGRTDTLVMSLNEPLAYFHNRTDGGHWLTLRLEGRRSNRDAVGARVTVHAGGRTRVAQRFGGGSYQSAGDPRLHFGLAGATRADRVEVRWPAGGLDLYRDLAADSEYLLREGSDAPVVIDSARR